MSKTTLEIRYKRKGGRSRDLDDEIQKFFEELGFKWTGQGFDFLSQMRHIHFEKEQKD